ncbi:hypothetical protein BDQ17DRAFT_1325938 [Cyathus striatus]|nr:hypothetical protein BDQ17DRAFT_1325938 [Cyathus striatus]
MSQQLSTVGLENYVDAKITTSNDSAEHEREVIVHEGSDTNTELNELCSSANAETTLDSKISAEQQELEAIIRETKANLNATNAVLAEYCSAGTALSTLRHQLLSRMTREHVSQGLAPCIEECSDRKSMTGSYVLLGQTYEDVQKTMLEFINHGAEVEHTAKVPTTTAATLPEGSSKLTNFTERHDQ